MPRYLSPRKAHKYQEVIKKMAEILRSNKFSSYIIEGSPSALYDDLWTIRSTLFKQSSQRFKFKKQYNGVWVEILPTFGEDEYIDVYDGVDITETLTKNSIASYIIMHKPRKVRFGISHLDDSDVEKLHQLAITLSYATHINPPHILFEKHNADDAS